MFPPQNMPKFIHNFLQIICPKLNSGGTKFPHRKVCLPSFSHQIIYIFRCQLRLEKAPVISVEGVNAKDEGRKVALEKGLTEAGTEMLEQVVEYFGNLGNLFISVGLFSSCFRIGRGQKNIK
jgi:hypothetical protein